MIIPTINHIYIFLCIVCFLWISITLLKIFLAPSPRKIQYIKQPTHQLVIGGFAHPNYVSSMKNVPYYGQPPPPMYGKN